MSVEQWRVPPSAPDYEVSDLGRVRSYHWPDGPRILFGSVTGAGYRQVTLRIDGKRAYRTVHSLVAEAFHGPRPFPSAEVRHFDGDRMNNAADNLLWGTASENRYDSVRHGTHPMIARRRRTA